jgi:NADPH2:quinone reductase
VNPLSTRARAETKAIAVGIPATTIALRTHSLQAELGGLALEEIPIPRLAAHEVLVRVHAASIGFPDLLMTYGGYHFKPELPFTGGMDVAGVVVGLGAGVEHVGIGEAVAVMHRTGGFSQYSVYPASAVMAKPATLTFAQTAAMGSAYLTAYVALVRCADIEPGEWLLVHGASGGVGLATVDLGRALGARVIAAASSRAKLDTIAAEYSPAALLESRPGFHEQVRAITGAGAQVIFDPVGGDTFTESTRCIGFGGRLLVVGFASGNIPSIATNIALLKGFSVVGVRAGEYGRRFPDRGRENEATIQSLALTGRIRPRVHAELPLSRWREGFQMLMERAVIGRVVLVPQE